MAFVGSKQGQVGILWGNALAGVVICTSGGRHGKRAGYEDGPQPDGSWRYFGQGEKGNQNPDSFANKLLVLGDRSVLLFRTREPTAVEVRQRGDYRKRYVFVGEFCVGSWDYFTPDVGKRAGDKLLRFNFFPVQSLPLCGSPMLPSLEEEVETFKRSLRDKLTLEGRPARRTSGPREYFRRSEETRAYALLRAAGVCECCRRAAPFSTPYDSPFLEVHHLLRLADDGPDIPGNVCAICPNCHREIHYGKDGKTLNDKVCMDVAVTEELLDRK